VGVDCGDSRLCPHGWHGRSDSAPLESHGFTLYMVTIIEIYSVKPAHTVKMMDAISDDGRPSSSIRIWLWKRS
jgi:hypothetical protein